MRGDAIADLFDAPQAEAAKAAGMASVDAGADAEWRALMEAYSLAVARDMEYFTSDDVFERARLSGMTATTRDLRAFGPVMMRLAKAGVCRKADRAPVNSRRASLHASPRAVWQSLIWTGGAS